MARERPPRSGWLKLIGVGGMARTKATSRNSGVVFSEVTRGMVSRAFGSGRAGCFEHLVRPLVLASGQRGPLIYGLPFEKCNS